MKFLWHSALDFAKDSLSTWLTNPLNSATLPLSLKQKTIIIFGLWYPHSKMLGHWTKINHKQWFYSLFLFTSYFISSLFSKLEKHILWVLMLWARAKTVCVTSYTEWEIHCDGRSQFSRTHIRPSRPLTKTWSLASTKYSEWDRIQKTAKKKPNNIINPIKAALLHVWNTHMVCFKRFCLWVKSNPFFKKKSKFK